MDGFIRLIEAEVHNALQHARVIGMIHTERNAHDDYIEDSYVVAWQRDNRGGHRGEGDNWGTHRAQVNNKGEVMLVIGHYDIPSRKEALSHMLERAGIGQTDEVERLRGEWRKADDGWIAAREEIDRLHKALELSVCYTPQAIKDSFDGADEDHPDAKWAREATDEQLLEVSHMIVGSDPTWKDFHSNIEMCIEAVRNKKEDKP